MQRTMLPGVEMWSVWQSDRNMFFNSFFIATPQGNLVVDPLALPESDAKAIEGLGGVAWIVITNRDHERDSRTLAKRFHAQLAASGTEAELLSGPVDRTLRDGDSIAGARVIALHGLKTPGEFALHVPALDAVVVGDALWGDPAGSVRLMPDDKLADPAVAAQSLRALLAARPRHLLLGDGACIFGSAVEVLQAALEARTETFANRINRADVPWKHHDDGPDAYRGRVQEIGDYIGAKKLGFRVTEVLPGRMSCPMHWHGAEEELFVVLSGSSTLITARGETELRAGDYVTFPTRASAAHKIANRSNEPCEILMIANTDVNDVCYYPDSQKLLVEQSDTLVRSTPQLTYFDGEPGI